MQIFPWTYHVHESGAGEFAARWAKGQAATSGDDNVVIPAILVRADGEQMGCVDDILPVLVRKRPHLLRVMEQEEIRRLDQRQASSVSVHQQQHGLLTRIELSSAGRAELGQGRWAKSTQLGKGQLQFWRMSHVQIAHGGREREIISPHRRPRLGNFGFRTFQHLIQTLSTKF